MGLLEDGPRNLLLGSDLDYLASDGVDNLGPAAVGRSERGDVGVLPGDGVAKEIAPPLESTTLSGVYRAAKGFTYLLNCSSISAATIWWDMSTIRPHRCLGVVVDSMKLRYDIPRGNQWIKDWDSYCKSCSAA